jgi:hypothetical protein
MDQPANVLMAAVLGRVGINSPLREKLEVAPLAEAHCLPCQLPNVIKSQRFQLSSREVASTLLQHLGAHLVTNGTFEHLKETRSLFQKWPLPQYLTGAYISGQSTLLQKRIPPFTSCSPEKEGRRKERTFGGSRKHGAVSAPAKDGLVGILPACKDGDAHAEHGFQASGHSGDLCAG